MQSAHFMHEMPDKTIVERLRLRENSDAMSCSKEASPVLLVIFCHSSTKRNKPSENSDGTFKRGNKKFGFNPEHRGKALALNIIPLV